MRLRPTLIVPIGIVCALASMFAQNAPRESAADSVLLRVTAEAMPSSIIDIPVTVRRIDKPGRQVDLLVAPGAVDAAVVPAGVYELVSQSPLEINGQSYQWRLQIPAYQPITRVRLSIANAVALDSRAPQTAAGEPQQTREPARTHQLPTAPVEASVEVRLRIDPAIASGEPRVAIPIELRRIDQPQPAISTTISNGVAQLRVAPGRYEVVTPQAVSIAGRLYTWDIEAPLTEAVNDVQLSEWQALVVGPEDSQVAKDSQKTEPARAREQQLARTEPADNNVDPEEVAIRELLAKWVSSLRNRDLAAHLACYAPTMDRYFRETNVNKSEVRQDKVRFLRRYPVLNKLEISGVTIHRIGDVAEANFRKSWEFDGPRPFRGEIAARLLLAKMNGRWVITTEREHYLPEDGQAEQRKLTAGR